LGIPAWWWSGTSMETSSLQVSWCYQQINSSLWKKGMQELLLQNLFIYCYWKF
jgi:hypothetical protein